MRIDIRPSDQDLKFGNKHLADDQLLYIYGLENGSMLNLNSPLSDFPVIVKSVDGKKKIPLDINKSDSIHMVKQKIEEKEGFVL
jgi:hypothetical protein